MTPATGSVARPGSRTPGLAALLWLVAACTSPPPAPLDHLRPVRIAVRASESTREISTLSYKGGFETKTLVYETLVKRDAEGRIAPALAQSWRFEDGGKECVLELRRNARFHDGSPVTAEAVREHFQRWVGLPEHDWLSCNRHILAVRAEGPQTLRIVMDEPRALLPDLCAINPCGIRAPSTLDFEGGARMRASPSSWSRPSTSATRRAGARSTRRSRNGSTRSRCSCRCTCHGASPCCARICRRRSWTTTCTASTPPRSRRRPS